MNIYTTTPFIWMGWKPQTFMKIIILQLDKTKLLCSHKTIFYPYDWATVTQQVESENSHDKKVVVHNVFYYCSIGFVLVVVNAGAMVCSRNT